MHFSYQKCTVLVMPPLPMHLSYSRQPSIVISVLNDHPHLQTPMSLFSLEEEPILGLIIVTGPMPLYLFLFFSFFKVFLTA